MYSLQGQILCFNSQNICNLFLLHLCRFLLKKFAKWNQWQLEFITMVHTMTAIISKSQTVRYQGEETSCKLDKAKQGQ